MLHSMYIQKRKEGVQKEDFTKDWRDTRSVRLSGSARAPLPQRGLVLERRRDDYAETHVTLARHLVRDECRTSCTPARTSLRDWTKWCHSGMP